MTASPFDQNSWARHISDDGHAIGAAGDMPPILVRKPHSRTGTVHKPFYPFFEKHHRTYEKLLLWIGGFRYKKNRRTITHSTKLPALAWVRRRFFKTRS